MSDVQSVGLDKAAMAADVAKMAEANEAKKAIAEIAKPATESGLPSSPNPGMGAQPLGETPTSSIWEDALKAEAPAQVAEESPEEAAVVKKSTGYQRLKQQNAELQQMAQQFQQVGPEIQALREQNAALGAQLQLLLQGTRQPVDPNDPMVKLTQELQPTFRKELEPFQQQLRALQEQNQMLSQAMQDRERQAERNALREEYTARTQAALNSVMFSDAKVEDPNAQALMAKTVTLLALADKSTPEEAARKLRRTMIAWAQGFEKTRGAQAREKMQAQANVPRPAPESTTRSEGNSWPSVQELRADGRFANVHKWDIAGRPALRKAR